MTSIIDDFYQQVTDFNNTIQAAGTTAILNNPSATDALTSATLELMNVNQTIQSDLNVQGVQP